MALQFTTINQILSVAGANAVDPPQLTLMARILITDFGTNNVNLWRKDSGGSIRFTSQNFSLRFFYQWDSPGFPNWTSPPIQPNVLTHVAVTYDNGSFANVPAFYVNGSPRGLVTTNNPPLPSSNPVPATGNWKFGNNTGRTQGWLGTVEDARLYSRVLTPEEIATIALGFGNDGIVESLELSFPLNDVAPGEIYLGTGVAANVAPTGGPTGNVLTSSGSPIGSGSETTRKRNQIS